MTPQQQAQAELARREIARRQSAKQTEPQTDGILQKLSNVADDITSTMPAVAGLMAPTLGLAQYAGAKINEASGRLGEAVTDLAGRNQVPGVGAALIGTAASIATNPMTYMDPAATAQPSFKLGPSVGKPGLAARIKQMRTGVEAGDFERLRRDPGAFFLRGSRQEAGEAIGEAKTNADINLGVTGDVTSLTLKNMQKARNVQAAGTKAENAVVGRIEDVLETGDLPVLERGSKTGDPHALFAYTDEFGPEGAKRNIYNAYGDPEHPALKQLGFGSSVTKDVLDKAGIKVTGREPRSTQFERIPQNVDMGELVKRANITPDEVSTALDGINDRLSKLERTSGKGSPKFQKWAAIKNQFQGMLEQVAPNVKVANADFSRVALRDKFMEPFPVNQSGTMSKINSFGFTPLAATAGGMLGGIPAAAATAAMAQAVRAPFVAGLGTATRGLLDQAVDPVLTNSVNTAARRGGLVESMSPNTRQAVMSEFINRFVVGKSGQ